MNNPPVSLLPLDIQRSILEKTLSTGRMQLSLLENPLNPLGQLKLRALKHELLFGRSLSLIFEGQDLGTCYKGIGVAVNTLNSTQEQIVTKLRYTFIFFFFFFLFENLF